MSAVPDLPSGFSSWLVRSSRSRLSLGSNAGIFRTGQPERFFEVIIAWSDPEGVEMWRLHVTRGRDQLWVNMEPQSVRDDTATVLVAGSRDDILDL